MKKSRAGHTTEIPAEIPDSIAVLATGMADDFNNILTTVMGACSLVDKEDVSKDELLQYISLIRESAERAAALSDRLVRISMPPQNTACCDEKPANIVLNKTSKRDKNSFDDIVFSNHKSDGTIS